MSLINKYRPKRWEDVAGHEVEIKRLKGIIKLGTQTNAVLFAGPSGLGKTTLARMFANYMNCEKHTFCGECRACKSKGADIVEINGAANNKIDDMRTLMETLRFKPQHGKYRFVIIDEVQQLTTQAEQCFGENTLVETSDGLVKISDILVGDKVFSFNHLTEKTELRDVVAVSEKQTSENMLRIYTGTGDSDYFECTENHRIWSNTRQSYVYAKDILEGEDLAIK